ncbi:DNA topoisomerase [Halomonas elongata]|nr:DNA topoisomerase [Halomonas elongata]WVI71294.1 DNA topoisomerase [Halomonas elongata]
MIWASAIASNVNGAINLFGCLAPLTATRWASSKSSEAQLDHVPSVSLRETQPKLAKSLTVTWVFGHLLEPAPPEAYNPDLKRWTLEALPILPEKWKLEVKPSAKKQFNVIKKLLGSASEVVIATDAEREGELIAREVLEACRFSGRCHACGCHHSMTPVSARQGQPGQITELETTRKREKQPLVLDLATLQQVCSRRWGYGAQQVLDIAQALYETHKATTYPRTDCRYLPMSQLEEAQQVVTALQQSDSSLAPTIDQLDLTRKSRVWNDSQITAHHGIIPTTAACDPGRMSEPEWNVYDLIRRHYLAQFLPAHEYDQTDVALRVAGERFTTTGRQVRVEGWKVLFRRHCLPCSGTPACRSARSTSLPNRRHPPSRSQTAP